MRIEITIEIFETEHGGHPDGDLDSSPSGRSVKRPVVESPHACGDGAVQGRCEPTAPPNSVAPGMLPSSARALHHGAGHADEAVPVIGTGDPAPENSESREGMCPPEAEPILLPPPNDDETAAIDYFEIPPFLRRNPDNSLPGIAA